MQLGKNTQKQQQRTLSFMFHYEPVFGFLAKFSGFQHPNNPGKTQYLGSCKVVGFASVVFAVKNNIQLTEN